MNPWARKKNPPLSSTRIARREKRFSVPVLSVRINVELMTDQQTYHGVLWDISTHGACIKTFEPIPIGITCRILLHQHAGSQVVERQATLLWTDEVMRAHYVGMSFDKPIAVDSTSFLGILIENSLISRDDKD